MANESQTFNAKIDFATLSVEYPGIWSSTIRFSCGHKFGGYHLKGEAMAIWVVGICDALGIEDWGSLGGQIVRCKGDGSFGPVSAIGHPIEDKWFTPSEAFAHITEKKAS